VNAEDQWLPRLVGGISPAAVLARCRGHRRHRALTRAVDVAVQTLARPRARERQAVDLGTREWSLLSSQGQVLFYVALCPGCTMREIALALRLTQRAVWNAIRTLKRSRAVHIRRHGRANKHYVNLDAPLFAPAITSLTLRALLGEIVAEAQQRPSDICQQGKDD